MSEDLDNLFNQVRKSLEGSVVKRMNRTLEEIEKSPNPVRKSNAIQKDLQFMIDETLNNIVQEKLNEPILEDISEETLNRYKSVMDTYNKLRNEIESLIDIEMKSHSTYTLQKKGIGSNTYKFLKDPDLRDRLGTETILRIIKKMISR